VVALVCWFVSRIAEKVLDGVSVIFVLINFSVLVLVLRIFLVLVLFKFSLFVVFVVVLFWLFFRFTCSTTIRQYTAQIQSYS